METIAIKLLSPLTHEGKDYQIDDVLNVDKQTANYLITRQVAQLSIQTPTPKEVKNEQ